MSRTWARIAAPVVLFALLAVAWQVAAAALGPLVLPDLGSVAAALATDGHDLAPAALVTFGSALAGLGAATVVALALAALCVAVPVMRAAVVPVALLISVTPVVAIAPALYVLLRGLAYSTPLPQVVLAALTAFFPLLVSAIRGLTDVDREAAAVFRVLAATRWETFLRLRLPSSSRSVLTGLRLSATLAVIGAVVAELTGGSTGLGAVIAQSQNGSGGQAELWAAVFVSAVGTLALVGIVTLVERRLVRW